MGPRLSIARVPLNISRPLHSNLPEKDAIEMPQRMDHLVSASNSSEAELEALQLSSMVRENAGRFQKHLNAGEKDIFERRILSDQPVTLVKLGDRHGVSRERIRIPNSDFTNALG